MPSVDELNIEINAKASSANDALDRLISKLDRLTSALEKVNGSAINGLANSVEKLGKSMQVVNSVKTSDFTRLTRNIEKLSQINTASLNTSASAINILSKSVNSLGNVSQQAQQIGVLASNLSKLGYKSIATASQNIPQLANALRQLMVTLSNAPRVNYNIVQMTNALANLAGQLKGVKSTTSTSKASFNGLANSMNKATRSSFSLAAAFGKFYATYFLVIRAIKGLWKSVEDTSDYIESFNYFTVAFGKIASKWDENWKEYGSENAKNYGNAFVTSMSETISKLSGLKVEVEADGFGMLTKSGAKNLGLNIQQITQYAAQLASVTNSLGQTGETSLAIADSFTKLAGDISSLFNVDFDTVAKNLQSGLLGQSRALYKYGIDITNATLQTYAYELGLEKTVSEMTQMEKQQLRVLAILKQSKVSWGDLANTIESPSNMIRQLTNNLKEAGMVLGQLFVPAVEKILPVINGFSIAIKQLLVDVAGIMGIKINFNAFGEGYSELEDEVGELGDELDDTTESANKLKNALRGFDKLNVLSSGQRGLNASLGQSFDLTDQIKKATEEYNKLWDEAFKKMESKAQVFAQKVALALEPVKQIIRDFAIGDYFQAGKDVSKLVADFSDFLSRAIAGVDWEGVGKSIGDFLAGIDWKSVIKSAFKLAFDIGQAIADVWLESFNTAPIETAIVTALAAIKFSGAGSAIAGAISKAIGVAGGLQITLIGGSLVWGAYKGSKFDEWNKIVEELRGGNAAPTSSDAIKYAMLASQPGSGGFLDRIAAHQYVESTASQVVQYEQAQLLKKLGEGIVDLFDRMIKSGWTPIGYASGGFPEDGWFRASKGEYFGSFDDGTSVIANNGQIIGGIANGVREANAEQNQLLREQNALLRQILAKDTGISSRDVFNAVRTEDRNYSLRNGQSAFAY